VSTAFVEAFELTGKERYARTAREILEYVERDMTDESGGFFSAEDADSEGEEGKFNVWTTKEVVDVLGQEDAEFFIETFHLEDEGNFVDETARKKTGSNIPHLREELLDEAQARFELLRVKLFERREGRVHPQKDDKILTDWNGLMISAYAKAAQALDEEKYAAIATKATDFVLEKLRSDDGRLLKRYRRGESGLAAHLEDYAFMIGGLIDLYETTFEVRHLEQAIAFQGMLDEHFWDEETGGYFTVADDGEQLIVRAKKLYGGAIPSGNAVSIGNLARLYRMTGQPAFGKRADELIRAFSGEIAQNSMVYPVVLTWLDFYLEPGHEVVISAPTLEIAGPMIEALRKGFRPGQVVLVRTDENADALSRIAAFTETQSPREEKATAYVCRSFACKLPTTDVGEMIESLSE